MAVNPFQSAPDTPLMPSPLFESEETSALLSMEAIYICIHRQL
jgi:hypothetical protein